MRTMKKVKMSVRIFRRTSPTTKTVGVGTKDREGGNSSVIHQILTWVRSTCETRFGFILMRKGKNKRKTVSYKKKKERKKN